MPPTVETEMKYKALIMGFGFFLRTEQIVVTVVYLQANDDPHRATRDPTVL